jgi:hypothetical protein
MKKILIIPFLFVSLICSATKYYVSTTGSDGAAGSIGAPWATWQKGFSSIVAGDTLYIRGGTYTPVTATVAWSIYDCAVYVNNHDGTSGNKISVINYPNETPILNCSGITSGTAWAGIFMPYCDYWYIKGLRITASKGRGLFLQGGANGGNNNIFERCVFDHNFLSGICLQLSMEGNLIKNCDAYANYDSPLGDNADGIEISGITYRAGNPRINTIRGCRTWFNSDDGIDLFNNDGTVVIDSCWSWSNGYLHNTITHLGDGNGIKLGATISTNGSAFQRTVTNCLSFYNYRNGIDQNAANVKMYIYNNTVYLNVNTGINFYTYNIAHIFRNNVSFGNLNGNYLTNVISNFIIDHNSYDATWQPAGPIASSADFVSVDTTGVSGARQSNGTLPVLTFLHLVTGSDLKDVGTFVGIPFYGLYPDLGAFEFYITPIHIKRKILYILR